MNRKIQSVGVVGTGVIGSSWAAFYSSKGLKVRMYDIDPSVLEKGYQRARSHLKTFSEKGLMPDSAARKSMGNLRVVDNFKDAVGDVLLVQESVAESYKVKQEVFQIMDAYAPQEAILASSSSGLLISEIQKAAEHPERCLIAHPFNPPHLIPLVELVTGQRTDPQIVTKMKTFFEGLGKIPVVLKKEIPGHIANRLAAALWREATDIVLKGIASVEDVDKALFAGPGIRWALMGQHLIYHLGGGEGGLGHFIDHLGPAFEDWWKSLATWTSLPPETNSILKEGIREEVGERSMDEIVRWRDDKVIELVKLIYR